MAIKGALFDFSGTLLRIETTDSWLRAVPDSAPRLFRIACTALGLEPHDVLMVGDDQRADAGAAELGCAMDFVGHLPVADRPDGYGRCWTWLAEKPVWVIPRVTQTGALADGHPIRGAALRNRAEYIGCEPANAGVQDVPSERLRQRGVAPTLT